MLLVLRRDGNPTDDAPGLAGSEQAGSVTSVDGEGRVLGRGPLPLVTQLVLDLETGNGPTEEKSPASEVYWDHAVRVR